MPRVIKNSKVVYVEPNMEDGYTQYDSVNMGTVKKSVALEDMAITVGLEVEVKGRTYASTNNGNSENITLEWTSSTNGDKISFMKGTRIPTSDGGYVNSLTTNYTDCHLYDLKEGGTSEMFGIQSIDIAYDNFMIPEVTIQFVDVRGVSLFAQEEMRHRKYGENGMSGLVDNSIEGSFFKCFFTFPYPKFTLKVKGFYGDMVSYELTCTDFRAAFDSNSGNFNVTARFIGYSFAFLNDVMVNGMVSAPYSEYIGKEYWQANLNDRFRINDGNGDHEMPKLGFICSMYHEVERRAIEEIKQEGIETIIRKYATQDDNVDAEIKAATEGDLTDLSNSYMSIIDQFKSFKRSLSGKDVGFSSGNADFAFILDSEYGKMDELGGSLEKLRENILKKRESGSKVITEFVNSLKDGKFATLDKYEGYGDIVDSNGDVKPDVIPNDNIRKQIKDQGELYLKDGVQYKNAWQERNDSEVYVYIDNGLFNILRQEAQLRSSDVEMSEATMRKWEQRVMNSKFNDVFGFIPTVENITKIIMAHIETFLHMITQCANNIEAAGTARSVGNLGIRNISSFPDIGGNNTVPPDENTLLAPFPKVTDVLETDEVKKSEGAWIGDILSSDQAEEIKLVEGLLNGISEAANDINKTLAGSGEGSGQISKSPILYPLSYTDISLKNGDNPFGDVRVNDANDVFAHLCIRAFSIFATRENMAAEPTIVGNADAENFLKVFDGTALSTLRSVIQNKRGDEVVDYLASGKNPIDPSYKNVPWWGKKEFISQYNSNSYVLTQCYAGNKQAIFHTSGYHLRNISDNVSGDRIVLTSPYGCVTTPYTDSDKSVSNLEVIRMSKLSSSELMQRYSLLANSPYESEHKLATHIFGAVKEFSGFGDAFDGNDMFIKEGKPALFSESVSYKNGEFVNSSNVTLNLNNFYLLPSVRTEKSQLERARKFIKYVFPESSDPSHSILSFNKVKPTVSYWPKFAILRAGALMDQNSKGYLRPEIYKRFENMFTNWAMTEYPKIEDIYRINVKEGVWFEVMYSDMINSDHSDSAIRNILFKYIDDIPRFETAYGILYQHSFIKADDLLLITRKNSVMDDMLKDLMQVMSVYTTTKFNMSKARYERIGTAQPSVLGSKLKGYFDGFMNVIRDRVSPNSDGSTTQISVNTDPQDIKVGVYDYLKMLYDKWVAYDMQGDFYRMENLFGGKDPVFHFIDSAYNDIGDSMYLNLSKLVDKIVGSQTQSNYTVLSMMSALYAENKFMFLCIQNFLDMSEPRQMERMFRPIPYIETERPDNRPNFIVLQPYEPSSRLDVPGANYPDDGFYLNDETESSWPLAISTKQDGSMPIPAFGVCYGQQYQNYFKNVTVDMNSPMSTEQSIKAKFLVSGAYGSGANNGMRAITYGQDLYTIYSNNSYTCTVTMLGCAWVQPMMYFVLQNVPMFRGSYMIVKVSHSIQPGNMSTTFKGIRMSNTATRTAKRFLYTLSTDSNGKPLQVSSPNIRQGSYADVANGCDYAYYTPTMMPEIEGLGDVNNVTTEDKAAYCRTLYEALTEEGHTDRGISSPMLTPQQAKGVLANIYAESNFNPFVCTVDSNTSKTTHCVGGGLAGFRYIGHAQPLYKFAYGDEEGMRLLNELNDIAEEYWNRKPGLGNDKYKEMMAADGVSFTVSFEYQMLYICKWINDSSKTSEFKDTKTEQEATDFFMKYYEQAGGTENRWNDTSKSFIESAIRMGGTVKTQDTKEASGNTVNELCERIRSSVEKSLRASQKYSDAKVTMRQSVTKTDTYEYKTENKDHSSALFDCMLSTYSKWFDSIEWNTGSGQVKDPSVGTVVHLAESKDKSKTVAVSVTCSGQPVRFSSKDDLNEDLKVIMTKYFQKNGVKDAPTAKSIFRSCSSLDDGTVNEIFGFGTEAKEISCDCVMGTTNNPPTGTVDNFSDEVTNPLMKKVLSDVNHIDDKKRGKNYQIKKKDAHSRCVDGPTTWYNRAVPGMIKRWWVDKQYYNSTFNDTMKNMTEFNTYNGQGFNLVWHGTREQALTLSPNILKHGDISTLHVTGSSHAAMWTGHDWRSDFIQNGLWCYGKGIQGRLGEYSVCIWRHPLFQ